MIKPFNKIHGMSKKCIYDKITNIDESKINISSNEELVKLFNYDNFAEILNNKHFIKSAKNIYSSILP